MESDVTGLLILAMIEKAGTDSFYALRKATALVPGVLLLRIKQLTASGAMRTGATGERGKKGLKLTAKGRALLEQEWRSAAQRALQESFDVVLKAFWLTRLMEGQDSGLNLLERAYHERKRAAKRTRDLAGDHASAGVSPLQAGYAYLQAQVQPARFDTEATMFRDVAEVLRQQRSEW